jgi:uncharacterized protein
VTALLSPVVMFFLLGAFASLVRSDLSVPEPIAKALAIYLMIAIGLKGGVEVSAQGLSVSFVLAAAIGIGLSFLLPLPAFAALRLFGRVSRANAGAVAAHYGSVSVVTFVTGLEVLSNAGTPAAGYMVAVLAVMETPAIVTGLLLARGGGSGNAPRSIQTGLLHETILNGAVLLLVGSFVIGAVIGKAGFASIAPVFDAGFRGALCIFLLDMGLLAARRLIEARSLTWRLIVLGIALPLVNGTIGAAVGALVGLDAGSAAALAILAASASYIAVPAAMRMALPEAEPGLYLAMSLGITFPLNITLGIPLFAALAGWMVAL